MANTIPLHYAQSLLRLVPMPHRQLEEELTQLKLPLVLLGNKSVKGTRISTEDYGRLFVHLVRRLQHQLPRNQGSGDNALVFSAYRMMYQAMLHAPNLDQALRRASIYFQRLQEDGETFHLDIDGDRVYCRFEFVNNPERTLASLENYSMDQLSWLPGFAGHVIAMSMWHRVCSWFIGCHIELQGVEMQQEAEMDGQCQTLFGLPVTFSAPRDAICFHRRYLDFPIVKGESDLTLMLETYPAELMRLEPGDNSVASKVAALIGTDFQRELPGLQDIADRLHMTTPTLHRRLREEGTSFQKIKDDCRRNTATKLLDQGGFTTSQLAETLGFSDASTFHRAFKKWTGTTPQQYANGLSRPQ